MVSMVPTGLKHAHSVMTHHSSSTSIGSGGGGTAHSDDSHPTPRRSKHKHHHDHHHSHHDPLPPPVLVYHESARSIVFRDHLRRKAKAEELGQDETKKDEMTPHHECHSIGSFPERGESHASSHHHSTSSWNDLSSLFGGDVADAGHTWEVEIQGFQPHIVPLPHLQLGANDEFAPLLESSPEHTSEDWTDAEREVVQLLETQQAVIKTIKNTEWTSFLRRFETAHPPRSRYPDTHNDIPPSGGGDQHVFNSFVTSTSLLPPGGRKMRCFGTASVYTTGCVFALPKFDTEDDEREAVEITHTWSWPSGYSAKTEFNIGHRGELLNGRQEALVSLSTLRQYNREYLTQSEYMVGGRMVQSTVVKTVPYNELFLRVGGLGRIVRGKDVATGRECDDRQGTGRSLDRGTGLPVALFVRTATFGHLISLLRTRARLSHVLGEEHIQGIPLLYMTSDHGIRVLTEKLQHHLLKIASHHLNPFQNPDIAHKTTMESSDPAFLETKIEELIELDDTIRRTLTPEECVRLAGGFGVSDESIAQILKDAMNQDKRDNSTNETGKDESHRLQDIVNEGLASAVRSGDYYTSRQLLILYSLVASEGHNLDAQLVDDMTGRDNGNAVRLLIRKTSLDSDAMLLKRQENGTVTTTNSRLPPPPPPPPPPLDTDRLRSATNSDGLLAVLGAAQVLKAMQDGSAKKKTEESFLAVEEWVEHGEQSMAFRLASWRDQRAAQDDLQIATDTNSSFMAFVSKKAITNRTNFARQLREATKQTDFSDIRFLRAIYEVVQRMHSPCLRLELLQYVLGLDNRYSIAHVMRSIELAATCLSITAVTDDASSS